MSFMYNPFPFDDLTPVNRPSLREDTANQLIRGSVKVAAYLAGKAQEGGVIAVDGYVGADFERTVNLLEQQLHVKGFKTRKIDFRNNYKSKAELWELVDRHLSWDRSEDPTLLFGRVYKGGYEGLMDRDKIEMLKRNLDKPCKEVTIVYGQGCLIPELRCLYQHKVYLDVTPKESILRIRRGQYINLGMDSPLTTPLIIRRCYYCDFEVAVKLRKELMEDSGNVDYYVENDHPDDMKLLPFKAFSEITGSLAGYPFRCKPVYLEGVWGGTYMKKLRKLPKEMRNAAWVFDLIPMEVSILVDVAGTILELPFSTFFMKEGDKVLVYSKESINKYLNEPRF